MVSPGHTNKIWAFHWGLILFTLLAQQSMGYKGNDPMFYTADSLINIYPDSAELYLDRGELFRINDYAVKANEDYQMVQILRPKWNVLNYCRAQLSLENNDWKRALEYLNKYLKESPKDVDGHILRGEIYLKYRNKSKAEEDFKHAMYLHGKVPSLFYYQIGKLYLKQQDTTTAENWLIRGISNSENNDLLHGLAFDIETAKGEFEKALTRLEKQFKHRENKVRYYLKKGFVLEKMGKKEEAMEAYRKGLGNMEIIPEKVSGTQEYAKFKRSLRQGVNRLK